MSQSFPDALQAAQAAAVQDRERKTAREAVYSAGLRIELRNSANWKQRALATELCVEKGAVHDTYLATIQQQLRAKGFQVGERFDTIDKDPTHQSRDWVAVQCVRITHTPVPK